MSRVDAFTPCAARRALLLGAGAAGLVGLAGCGAGSTTSAPPAQDGPSGRPSSPARTPGANPFDTGIAGGDATPAGGLVATNEVPVGGGVIVRDSRLVVQPRQGTFKAYKAICPHQGVIVEPPASGSSTISCPGHNSQFRVADGSLVRGPATRGLDPVPVKVHSGYVVEL